MCPSLAMGLGLLELARLKLEGIISPNERIKQSGLITEGLWACLQLEVRLKLCLAASSPGGSCPQQRSDGCFGSVLESHVPGCRIRVVSGTAQLYQTHFPFFQGTELLYGFQPFLQFHSC